MIGLDHSRGHSAILTLFLISALLIYGVCGHSVTIPITLHEYQSEEISHLQNPVGAVVSSGNASNPSQNTNKNTEHVIAAHAELFQKKVLVGRIGVGSPAKVFRVLVDTGSHYTWVRGAEDASPTGGGGAKTTTAAGDSSAGTSTTTTTGGTSTASTGTTSTSTDEIFDQVMEKLRSWKKANSDQTFDCSKSSSCQPFDKKYTLTAIKYGSGSVVAKIVNETVAIGGSKQIHNFPLLVTTVEKGMQVLQTDGVLGLSYRPPETRIATADGKENTVKRLPGVLGLLHEAYPNIKQLFTLNISYEEYPNSSSIIFGDWDREKYPRIEDLKWARVQSDTSWTVSYQIGDEIPPPAVKPTSPMKVLIDSGTAVIHLPGDTLEAWIAKINKVHPEFIFTLAPVRSTTFLGVLVKSLSQIDDLPDLPLLLDNQQLPLSLKHTVSTCLPNNKLAEYPFSCIFSVVATQGVSVLGLPFFFQYYVVFDAENQKVGFGRKVQYHLNSAILVQSGSLVSPTRWVFGEGAFFDRTGLWVGGIASVMGIILWVLILGTSKRPYQQLPNSGGNRRGS